MTEAIKQHIEIVPGAGGMKARVAGHSIRVIDIAIWHEKLGMSPDEIVHNYPTLTLADIHAALAYYWDHRDQIEEAIAEERALAARLRVADPGPLAEKMPAHEQGNAPLPPG